jgi:hypothetical protein
MWSYLAISLILLASIIPLSLQFTTAQQNIKSFEQRLDEQLANNDTNQTNSNLTTNLVTNSTVLDMPRSSSLKQIQAGNESISQLYNNSLQNMGISSEKTRQNISDILSILK